MPEGLCFILNLLVCEKWIFGADYMLLLINEMSEVLFGCT